jgi:nucleoside-diphosphate-sugar epimerase
MSKLNILITGASGSIGFPTFVELLASNTYEITVLLRDSIKNRRKFKRYLNMINIVWGKIENLDDVSKAVRGQDIIIHLAAIIPPKAKQDPEYTKLINVIGTSNLTNAAKNLDQDPKFIYLSSITVYGDRINNPWISITDPVDLKNDDVYTRTKIEAEDLIKQSGLEYVIFRLSYCTSPNSLRLDPLVFDVPLKTSIEIIDSRDVALAILHSIERSQVWNNIYNLGGGASCRIIFKDYLDEMFKIIGLGSNFLPENAFAKSGFHCGFYLSDDTQAVLGFQKHDLNDWYEIVRDWIGFKRHFVPLVRWFIRKYLLSKSIYYKKQKI